MLILTRRQGENIIIGKDVQVRVLNIKGNQVKLGFEAPKNIVIVREELIGQPKKEKVKEIEIPIIKKKRRKIDPQPIMHVKNTEPLPATFYDDH